MHRRLRRATIPALVLSGAALFATSLHGIAGIDNRLEVAAAVEKQQQKLHRTIDVRECGRDKPEHRERIRDGHGDRSKLRNKI